MKLTSNYKFPIFTLIVCIEWIINRAYSSRAWAHWPVTSTSAHRHSAPGKPSNKVKLESIVCYIQYSSWTLKVKSTLKRFLQIRMRNMWISHRFFSRRSKFKNNKVISIWSFSGLRLGGPRLSLDRPGLGLDRPRLSLYGPGLSLYGPGLGLRRPGLSFDGPRLGLDGPLINPKLTFWRLF